MLEQDQEQSITQTSNYDQVKKVPKQWWYFQQCYVKLLKITDNKDYCTVILMRRGESNNYYSMETVWKLPFSMNNMKTYLTYQMLSDEEKADSALMKVLTSYKPTDIKFETLIEYRINAIVNALKEEVYCVTKEVPPSSLANPMNINIMLDHYHPKHEENRLILNVIKANNIKPSNF